jgi:hypothetical protein
MKKINELLLPSIEMRKYKKKLRVWMRVTLYSFESTEYFIKMR